MKLYFFPGACSMSCHIALQETKTPFELMYVGKKADPKIRETFLSINPLGTVPTLVLSDGKILTQNIAILEYIADTHPESHLIAKSGTYERADTMRWLSFIASDLHKAFAPLFGLNRISNNPETQKHIKEWSTKEIEKYLSIVNLHLKNKDFLVGNHFGVADCYLFTVYQWTKAVSIPTEKFPEINRYDSAIGKRPSVISVKERENKYK